MLSAPRTLRALMRRRCRGNVAMEFAIVSPLMIGFVIGVFDISKCMILYQELYNATHTIAITASNMAVQPDQSTSLTWSQSQQAFSTIYAEVPWFRSGLESNLANVAMAAVTFVQTNSSCVPSSNSCTYTANTVWRIYYVQHAPFVVNQSLYIYRPCGTLNQVAAGTVTPGDLTSIGTLGITNPDPIIVVDARYQYTPLFFNFITGTINLWASAYWPVRSSAPGVAPSQQYTKFDIANQLGGQGKCPGYT
jgi:Flp pilus assembly protein TadG